jgi:cytochrome c oxidase subunit 4
MASDHGSAHAHGADAHHGPTTKIYLIVAFTLAVITAAEVWIFYIPGFHGSVFFVPSLLILSAAKFFAVVAFYMHLKYDHRIFRILFYGPLTIALGTITALLLLFSYRPFPG